MESRNTFGGAGIMQQVTGLHNGGGDPNGLIF